MLVVVYVRLKVRFYNISGLGCYRQRWVFNSYIQVYFLLTLRLLNEGFDTETFVTGEYMLELHF